MKLKLKKAFAAAWLFGLLLAFTTNASSQSNLNLRNVGKPEFLFHSLQDPLLFSETAFEINPAVLTKLKNGFFKTDIITAFSQDESADTRLDASIGSLAGTYQNLSRTFLPSLDVTHVFPVGKKKPSMFGYQVSGGMDYSLSRQAYIDYNSFSERMTIEQQDLPWEAKGGLFLSFKPRSVSFGFFTGYGLSYEPSLYRLVTDESFIPSETYVQDELRNADTWTHSAFARAGLLLSLSRTAEVSLSVDYEGGFADASRIWYYFDTNGNGTNDGLMPYADYVFYTGAGGPAEQALSYEAKDLTISTKVLLHPHLRVFLSDKLEMFLAGTYHLFDFSDRQYYTHVALPSDLELDQSMDQETHNRS